MSPDETQAVVDGLLGAAGLSPTAEERALFVAMYPVLRAKADRVYELDLEETGW